MSEKYKQDLSENHTLEVFLEDEAVFSSSGHWLHPLFELEDFLKKIKVDRASLSLHDSVQGRAAAALTVRLGIKKVKSNVLSSLALPVYEKAGAEVTYESLVPKIVCKTEELITDSMSEEEIYRLLCQRANRPVTDKD
ncbi:MAG: DUF1893 domain-containing protein [Sphaerochaetaceae bacterium]|nr:DUF1893 domain-containing protein [Sphaerochaetaceae bacterium]